MNKIEDSKEIIKLLKEINDKLTIIVNKPRKLLKDGGPQLTKKANKVKYI